MTPTFKKHRPVPCLADQPVHLAAAATHSHIWEMHIGFVQLFICGPGSDAWLACSESYYYGRVGTAEERSLARRAVAILARTQRQNNDAGPNEIRAALDLARTQSEPIPTSEDCEISQLPAEPSADLTEFEIVAEPTMPWRCIDCTNTFEGPVDHSPRGGCPLCGSAHVFDCNVAPPSNDSPLVSIPERGKKSGTAAPAAILAVIQTVADAAGLSPADFVGRARAREICHARHLAVATVSQEFPQFTSVQIAEIFHRDHSSILHSRVQAADLLRSDRNYQRLHSRVQSRILSTDFA